MGTAVRGIRYKYQSGAWTSPGRASVPPGAPPVVTGPKLRVNGVRLTGPVVVAPTIPGDWSDSNPPWAYTDTSVFTAGSAWGGAYIVDLQTGSSDFYTNLSNTVAAAGRRCVVRIPAGVFHLNQFRLIGSSGDPTYAFGFWFPNLQGFLGAGPDLSIIQMDANSMTTAQLNAQKTMTSASFAPLQMGLARFDGTNASSPILIAGVTFRAADQQMLTSVASDVPAAVPQPAGHQGVVFFYEGYYDIGYTRFQAAGRALTSSPPFELANLSTARCHGTIHNTEFDGRRAVELDPARPRRCVTIMGNNEYDHELVDVWLHHSNVSRYAMNDQNSNTTGTYGVTRVKSEHITELHNTDPALNGGVSLGGWTNASNFGWESCNGVLNVTDAFIQVDNGSTSGAFAAHLQLTSVGSRNPQGGRMFVKGGTFKHTAFAQLNGFLTFRIASNTFWFTDGVATTLDVRRADNTPLTGWNFTGTWPPTAAQIASAGISPTTHYIYKGV